MKIGIIGDTHFGAGYSLGRLDQKTQLNSRLLDFVDTFNRTIDEFIKNDVSTVIITGDIFETRHPTSAQLNAFSKCIQRAIDNDLETMIVVGNHDQQRTISTTTVDIFNSLNTPIKVYRDIDYIDVVDENGIKTSIVFMPYRDRRMIGTKTTAEAVDVIDKQIQDICAMTDRPRIAIGHFMIGKSITGENPDSFSINELILPISMFSEFDTVVMGHVHKHMVISEDNPTVLYCGSMERVSFGEKYHTKVSLILDTNSPGEVSILPTETRKLHEIDLDYTDLENGFEEQITDKIILDIAKFNMRWDMYDSIVKFSAKVKKNDMYHVNHDKIKDYIMSKNIKCLMSMHISSISSRKLRNRKITEDASVKSSMSKFIKQLVESDQVKRKLIKAANSIIEEVDGK